MGDFQKLGLDRLSHNLGRSVNNPTGGLFTGNITKGDLVTVEFDAEAVGTATVKARRTGAMPTSIILDAEPRLRWEMSGTTLTATIHTALTGSITFWVF